VGSIELAALERGHDFSQSVSHHLTTLLAGSSWTTHTLLFFIDFEYGDYLCNVVFFSFVFFNGRFIIGNDYVRMYVTLVDSSWVVVASVLTGVDFIPLKFADYRVALHSGLGPWSVRGAGALQRHASAWSPGSRWHIVRRTSCTPIPDGHPVDGEVLAQRRACTHLSARPSAQLETLYL